MRAPARLEVLRAPRPRGRDAARSASARAYACPGFTAPAMASLQARALRRAQEPHAEPLRHDDVPRLAWHPHLEQRHLARAEARHPHLLHVAVRHRNRPWGGCARVSMTR